MDLIGNDSANDDGLYLAFIYEYLCRQPPKTLEHLPKELVKDDKGLLVKHLSSCFTRGQSDAFPIDLERSQNNLPTVEHVPITNLLSNKTISTSSNMTPLLASSILTQSHNFSSLKPQLLQGLQPFHVDRIPKDMLEKSAWIYLNFLREKDGNPKTKYLIPFRAQTLERFRERVTFFWREGGNFDERRTFLELLKSYEKCFWMPNKPFAYDLAGNGGDRGNIFFSLTNPFDRTNILVAKMVAKFG